MKLESFPSEASWIEAVLAAFRSAEEDALSEDRPLELLLAGGSTPEPAYRALAALPLRARAVRLWLADEREVPAADPERNGAMIQRAFSASLWKPAPELRLWPEGPSSAAAELYAAQLGAAFGAGKGPGGSGIPGLRGLVVRFDLALLGVGTDGHAASLFPGEPILTEKDRLAATSRAPSEPRNRMSLTMPAIAASRRLLYLLRGSGKARIARALEAGLEDIPALVLAGLVEAAGGKTRLLFCQAEPT